MQDGQVFLYALATIFVAFGLFVYFRNMIVRVLFFLIGLGALYTSLVFWEFISGTFAMAIVALAMAVGGFHVLFKKKGKDRERRTGEVPVGALMLFLGIISFLTISGALSSSEGALGRLNDFLVQGGELVRELWNRTDQGIEQINQ